MPATLRGAVSRYQTIDLTRVHTYSVTDRFSKVEREAFAAPLPADASFSAFWKSLPDMLAVRELREFVGHIAAARGGGRFSG